MARTLAVVVGIVLAVSLPVAVVVAMRTWTEDRAVKRGKRDDGR